MKNQIEFSDFDKIDLRVGTIVEAVPFPDPKKTKLLVLKVDVGEEQPRTICAGIAEYYQWGDLIGEQIVIVANLAPRVFKGSNADGPVAIESYGMLLAAHGEKGEAVLVTTNSRVFSGSEVG